MKFESTQSEFLWRNRPVCQTGIVVKLHPVVVLVNVDDVLVNADDVLVYAVNALVNPVDALLDADDMLLNAFRVKLPDAAVLVHFGDLEGTLGLK